MPTRWGCRVIAVSSIEGGIYNPNGLDIPSVVDHQEESTGVVGFPDADTVTNDELLELDCDVLVPAAIESVIHQGNADRIKAAVVVEAANHPVTPEGDAILNDRGVHVLPDILVNAGGVIGSYFEVDTDLYQHKWDEDEVNAELHKIMASAYRDVWDIVQRERVHSEKRPSCSAWAASTTPRSCEGSCSRAVLTPGRPIANAEDAEAGSREQSRRPVTGSSGSHRALILAPFSETQLAGLRSRVDVNLRELDGDPRAPGPGGVGRKAP